MITLIEYLVMVALIFAGAYVAYLALDLDGQPAKTTDMIWRLLGWKRCTEIHAELGVQCERVQGHEPIHHALDWGWR